MEVPTSVEELLLENKRLKEKVEQLELRTLDESKQFISKHNELFQELGRKIGSARSDHDVANIIFSTAQELIGWDSCFLGIYHKELDSLTTIVECDLVNGEIQEFKDRYFQNVIPGPLTRHILLGNSLCGNREEILSNTLKPKIFGKDSRQSQSLILVPLQDHRRTIFGIMTIQSYTKDAFNKSDLKLFESMAEFCGEAISRSFTETKLRHNEERLNFALSGTKVGVWDWNLQTDSVTYTQQFADLTGYTLSEINSFNNFWRHITLPEDMTHAIQKLNDHIQGHTKLYEHKRRMRLKDGTVRWFLDRGKTVEFNKDGKPSRMTGTITDITDQLDVEARQKELEEQLQHAQKLESLGLLAGGIAHDFNNLLHSVIGNLDLAISKVQDKEVKEIIQDAESGAMQASDLTHQILAYAGKANFQFEKFNLSELVQEMAKLLNVSISKKVDILLNLDLRLTPVYGDLIQIRQVVMNLITNAADAIGENDGEIQITTSSVRKVQAPSNPVFQNFKFEPGRYICLEVADNGCGMDEETCQKIFDPFFTTKETGKGLGLAATLGIIRSHGGFLEIESANNMGTTFRIYFPQNVEEHPRKKQFQVEELDEESTDEKREKTVGAKTKELLLRNGKVLLIDDEESVRNVARRMLMHFGFEVIVAENGRVGLDLFNESREEVGMVLLDLMMPVMDGHEVFTEMRKVNPNIPVLFSSGYDENESTSSMLHREQLIRFIQKPYRRNQLIKEITQLLMEAKIKEQ